MGQTEAILSTVERIHDAAVTADAWQGAIESMADLLRGEHAMLLVQEPGDAGVTLAIAARMDERGFARLRSPEAVGWLDAATQAIPSGIAAIQSHLVSDRDFERTDFYNDFVRPVGGYHGISLSHRLASSSSFLIACRSRQADDFEAADQAALQSLSQHIGVALQVRQRLRTADLAAAGALAALERLSAGLLIVDLGAQVVFANEAALGMFHDGGGLKFDRDGLAAASPDATRALRRLIAAGCGTGVVCRGEVRAPLHVVAAPFQPARIGLDAPRSDKPLVLLLITDPERQRRAGREALRLRFGLTAAEADLALEIARGDGRRAAAARLKIAVTTARTHLTHIFEKTGVRRQAELVRLLMELGDEHSAYPQQPRPPSGGRRTS